MQKFSRISRHLSRNDFPRRFALENISAKDSITKTRRKTPPNIVEPEAVHLFVVCIAGKSFISKGLYRVERRPTPHQNGDARSLF